MDSCRSQSAALVLSVMNVISVVNVMSVVSSVAESGAGAAGATTFRAALESEPIFLLVGAGSRSRTF